VKIIVKFCGLWIDELAQSEAVSGFSSVIGKKCMARQLALGGVRDNRGGGWILSDFGPWKLGRSIARPVSNEIQMKRRCKTLMPCNTIIF